MLEARKMGGHQDLSNPKQGQDKTAALVECSHYNSTSDGDWEAGILLPKVINFYRTMYQRVPNFN